MEDHEQDPFLKARTSPSQAWEPGVWKQFPVLGFSALAGAICTTAAAVAILFFADGQETSAWSIQPTVLLAILSAFGIGFFGLAQSQGAVFLWWAASIKGSTLTDLHRNWKMGTSIWASLAGLHHPNLVSISRLSVAACIATGPLLQRAITVTSVSMTSQMTLSVPAATLNSTLSVTAIPNPDFDVTFISLGLGSFASPELAAVITESQTNTPIKMRASGCDGTCTGTIQSLGMVGGCKSSSQTMDWVKPAANATGRRPPVYPVIQGSNPLTLLNVTVEDPRYQLQFDDPKKPTPYKKPFAFNITFFTADSPSVRKNLTDISSATNVTNYYYETCSGTLTAKQCAFDLAVVDYDVQIRNETISFQQLQPGNEVSPKTFLNPNSSDPGYISSHDPAIQGLIGAFVALHTSSIRYTPSNPPTPPAATKEVVYSMLWKPVMSGAKYSQELFMIEQPNCSKSIPDPTDDIISSMTNILFRTGIAGAGFPPYQHQTMQGTQVKQALVFQTNYVYLYITAVISASAAVIIGITFHGFWRLGRAMTLSPLETARAMDSSLFEGAGTNTNIDKLLEGRGKQMVKYGVRAFEQNGAVRKGLSLAPAGAVRRPIRGELLD